MEQVTESGLVRGIRRWDVVALMVNGIIGGSIFALPSKLYALTGAYSLFVFAAAAFLIGLLTLCLAEVSSRFTETGGDYLYAREAFGPNFGFAIGWLFLLRGLSAFAFICNVMVSYVGFFWPPANAGLPRALIMTGIVATLAIINTIGVSRAAIACDILTIGKLIPLLLFVAVGLFFIQPQNYSFGTFPSSESFSKAVALAFVPFAGFEGVMMVTGEIREPRRNLLFALPIALVVTTILYLSLQAICIGTVNELSASETPLADASNRFIGAAGATLISAGVLISAIGTLSQILLISPRLLFAMAERKQVPEIVSRTHQSFHTPHVAIVLTAVISLTLALSGTFTYLVTINGITKLILFATVCVVLPALRRRENERPAAFRLPFGKLIAMIALIVCIWLLANVGWRELRDVGIALTVGLLLHFVYQSSRREKQFPRVIQQQQIRRI
jgi:amino acid transporter